MKKAIKKLKKQVSGILDILELIPTRAELQTIARHVQNLEAEKEKKCSCHIEKPKAEFDNELFSKLFIYNFEKESKQVNIDAINQAVYSGHSIIDIMEKYTRNAVAKATAKTIAEIAIQFNSPKAEMKAPYEQEYTDDHTNTQKTNKNATEGKEEGKKEYSEVIVTNEMFNEELEKRLSESFIQDHPAFLLLNSFISCIS